MLSFNEQQVQKVVGSVIRAIIYCRVSTDKQEQDGESLEFQEEKGRQYATLHGIQVILVLKEAKSGYIHYSYREQLTLARQMVRDGLADMIIVWDLRRFSRNFVHSAMIFEEIENAGGQIVSVSENVDNSLTGKLIRSILAWSAESEREKIIEYANRHWQTRLEQNLPVAGGLPPFGWLWKDENKTRYVINKEEAAVRIAIFEMFVNLDMSVRRIVHKLTEDGILSPTASRGNKKVKDITDPAEKKIPLPVEMLPSTTVKRRKRTKSPAWSTSTVHSILRDERNIGILRIGKTNHAITDQGKSVRIPNPKTKTIPGGIPAIVPVEMFELAQMKLKNNKVDKSHMHQKPEDFLLKGHVFCKTCGYSASSYYSTCGVKSRGKSYVYPFYGCRNKSNKYAACPDLPSIRTDRVNQLVWEDCCQVFERLEMIRDTLEYNIEQSLQNMLEDTTGRQHIDQLNEKIKFARQERDNHPEGSYYYNLISGDIREKEAMLQRYEEEWQQSINIVKLSNIYQQSTLGFLNFLTSMKGKYHEASFAEKRNALDVLGVKVYIHPNIVEPSEAMQIDTDQEWFLVSEASRITKIAPSTLKHHIKQGHIATQIRTTPLTVIYRDELARYLNAKGSPVDLEQYQKEWFSINHISWNKIEDNRALLRAIRKGKIETQIQEIPHQYIHRDELNRFLRETILKPRALSESIEPRVEVTYSPMFTGVQDASPAWTLRMVPASSLAGTSLSR